MSNEFKKTIKINPEIFNVGGKTKKNTEKKQKNVQPLLINSNSLKTQFLNRIREHKKKEKEGGKSRDNLQFDKSIINVANNKSEKGNFIDEFYDSVNYLSSLSKKNKEENNKINHEKKQQQKRENIANKTIKTQKS